MIRYVIAWLIVHDPPPPPLQLKIASYSTGQCPTELAAATAYYYLLLHEFMM